MYQNKEQNKVNVSIKDCLHFISSAFEIKLI